MVATAVEDAWQAGESQAAALVAILEVGVAGVWGDDIQVAVPVGVWGTADTRVARATAEMLVHKVAVAVEVVT